MNTRLVGKGIGPNHRFVRLHREASNGGNEAGHGHDLLGINARIELVNIFARTQSHDDFFQRGIARSLAETIDSTFNLSRTVQYGRQRIGNRQTEVVVAMH